MKNPKIEKCTITGLNITIWNQWQNLYCGDGYYTGFKLLGERIIISEVRGNSGNTGMLNLLKYRDGFAQYTGLSEKKHIEIRDYSKQRGQPSHSGRNQFAAWILRQDRKGNLLAYIGFNTNRGIRLAMAVGSKVHRIGFPLLALNDYRAAANQAVNILMNNNIPLYDNQNTPWISHESWKYKRDNSGWSFETSRGDILKINLYGDLQKQDISSFEKTYRSVIEYTYLQGLIHSRILDCSKLTQKSCKTLKPLLTEIFNNIEEISECMATCIITGKEKLITLPESWTRFKSIHEAYEYLLNEKDLLLKKLPASAEITPPETKEEIEKAINIVGGINWEDAGTPVTPASLEMSHPVFQPLIESLCILKSDFDEILKKKQEAEEKLKLENRNTRLRAEIYRILSNSDLSFDTKLSQFIQIIGSGLDASRSKYMKLAEETESGSSSFLLEKEWRNSETPSSEAEELPYYIVKHFLINKAALITPEFTRHFLPPYKREESIAIMDSYFERNGINSLCFSPVIEFKEEKACFILEFSETSSAGDEFHKSFHEYVNLFREYAKQQENQERQQELEKMLHHSEKMESIGQLAGGIAHDFNNQLSGIKGYSELALSKIDDPVRIRTYLEKVITLTKRSTDLASQLLSFAKKGRYALDYVNLHNVLKETISMLKHSIDKKITIEQFFTSTYPYVYGDTSQLQNVFLNIGLNARDAIEDNGYITFQTEDITITENNREPALSKLFPGKYIKIRITDTGCGIDDITVEHIFEPFYTTKKPGKGTGMGLAAAYGTVENHKGIINVDSSPGIGTSFDVYLPVKRDENEIYSKVHTKEPEVSSPGGHILLVDDEKLVAEMTSENLSDYGYRVSYFFSSLKALDFYKNNYKNIDAAVIDLMMPDMDGSELFKAFRETNPEVKAVIVSGYTFDRNKLSVVDNKSCMFLKKPYDIRSLNTHLINLITSNKGK